MDAVDQLVGHRSVDVEVATLSHGRDEQGDQCRVGPGRYHRLVRRIDPVPEDPLHPVAQAVGDRVLEHRTGGADLRDSDAHRLSDLP